MTAVATCMSLMIGAFAWLWGSRVQAAPVAIDDFTLGEGHFTSGTDAAPESGGMFHDRSSISYDSTVGHFALGSQTIVIDDDPAPTPRSRWTLRNLSGGGVPANNVTFASSGFVGFWLRTMTPTLRTSILIDEAEATGPYQSSRLRDVIADGEWHLYEWDLDATIPHTEWGGGDGLVTSPTVSIDAIFIASLMGETGEVDATVWVDDVSHNPDGSLVAEPGSLSILALGGVALLRRRHR